jgi:hypothetical protein
MKIPKETMIYDGVQVVVSESHRATTMAVVINASANVTKLCTSHCYINLESAKTLHCSTSNNHIGTFDGLSVLIFLKSCEHL